MKKSDFKENEDEVLSCECDNCGEEYEYMPLYDECEECESSSLTIYTKNECKMCDNCRHVFDMWDTTWEDNSYNILCEDCYDELED